MIVNLLKDLFTRIVNVGFTADMEAQLDEVEAGRRNWIETVSQFYGGFAQTLKDAEQKMDGTRVKVPEVESDVVCDLCGRNMVVKSGRFGKFLACPGYPECKNTKPIVQETPGKCPVCSGAIVQRKSKRGYKFYGCENRECKFMTWDDPTTQTCEKCGKTLFKKRGGVLNCLAEGCGFEKTPEKKTGAKKKAEKG